MSAVESPCNLLLLCQALSFQEIEINEPQKLILKKQSDKKAEVISSLSSSQPVSQSSSTCNSSRSVSSSGGKVEQAKKRIKTTTKAVKTEKAQDNSHRVKRAQPYKPSRNFAVFSKQGNNQSLVDKSDPNGSSKSIKMETLPLRLFGAFNSGHTGNLKDFVNSVTTETVSFKTDSMSDPKVGRQHFMKFFEVLEEVHPDAYIVSSDMKVIDHKTMTTTIYIKGTKVIASQNEHYIMKPRLVDNMNLTSLSSSDVDKLRELEHTLISQNRPIEIELVGLATFGFEDGSCSSGSMECKTINDAKVPSASVNGSFATLAASDKVISTSIFSSSSTSSSSSSSSPMTATATATDCSKSSLIPQSATTVFSISRKTSFDHTFGDNIDDNSGNNSNSNCFSMPLKKRKAWIPPLPLQVAATEMDTATAAALGGAGFVVELMEEIVTVVPLHAVGGTNAVTAATADNKNSMVMTMLTADSDKTDTSSSSNNSVVAPPVVATLSSESAMKDEKLNASMNEQQQQQQPEVLRFKDIAVIPSPAMLAAAAAKKIVPPAATATATAVSTNPSGHIKVSSSSSSSLLFSSPNNTNLSSPFSSKILSSPSSSTSSSSSSTGSVSKICDIKISYYLKSFRDAVIMPVS